MKYKEKQEAIVEAHKKAAELGHCLCNLKLECPCDDFINQGICKCAFYEE